MTFTILMMLTTGVVAQAKPRSIDLKEADRVALQWVQAARACGFIETRGNRVECGWRDRAAVALAHEANLAIARFYIGCSQVADEHTCDSAMASFIEKHVEALRSAE